MHDDPRTALRRGASMSAVVLPFAAPKRATPRSTSCDWAPIMTRAWADRHLPLIEAALFLLHADDAEFERRCQLMKADQDGVLVHLASQLELLGTHIGDVVEALDMTVTRIRTTVAAAMP